MIGHHRKTSPKAVIKQWRIRAACSDGYTLARHWDGGYPSWFAEWIDSERRATSLCSWEPLIMPGLLQTADYSRAILAGIRTRRKTTWMSWYCSARTADDLRSTEPPTLWAVLDEAVLHG